MRFFMSSEHVVWRFMTFTMIFGSLATFESLQPSLARLLTRRHLGSSERNETWNVSSDLSTSPCEGIESFTRIPRRYLSLTPALIIKLSFYHDPPLCESFSNFFTSNVVFMCVLGTSRSKCKSTQGSLAFKPFHVDNNEWLKSHCAPLITPRRMFWGAGWRAIKADLNAMANRKCLAKNYLSFALIVPVSTKVRRQGGGRKQEEQRRVTDLCMCARRWKNKKEKK